MSIGNISTSQGLQAARTTPLEVTGIWVRNSIKDDDLYQGDLEPDEETANPQDLVVDEQDKDDAAIKFTVADPIPAGGQLPPETTEQDSDDDLIKHPNREEAVLLGFKV